MSNFVQDICCSSIIDISSFLKAAWKQRDLPKYSGIRRQQVITSSDSNGYSSKNYILHQLKIPSKICTKFQNLVQIIKKKKKNQSIFGKFMIFLFKQELEKK